MSVNPNNWGLGITFGSKHSWWTWDLRLIEKNMPMPTPRTHYVEIPGRSGALDLTLSMTGFVQYEPRECEFVFAKRANRGEQVALMNEIGNYLHGKKMTIADDAEKDYYYIGRCEVVEQTFNRKWIQFKIKAVCEPFKMSSNMYFDTRFLGNVYTDNYVDFDNPRGSAFSGNKNVYIDDDGVETSKRLWRISHFIPMHPETNLWAMNAVPSDTVIALPFYLVEYDKYMGFLKRTTDLQSVNLQHETSEDCYFVVMGYMTRSPFLTQSKPCLQNYSGENIYADFNKTVRTNHLTAYLSGKEVVPTLVVNGNVKLTHEGVEETFSSGVYKTPSFSLKPGSNEISIEGYGSASITVQEVSL